MRRTLVAIKQPTILKGDNVLMDKTLGKIYLDETGEAPFVIFKGKAAATKEYVCWLERIVAENSGVAALQTTNSQSTQCSACGKSVSVSVTLCLECYSCLTTNESTAHV